MSQLTTRPTVGVDALTLLDVVSADRCWLVCDGELDVFAQARQPDGRLGARRFVVAVPAGGLLTGILPSSVAADLTVKGAGLPGTRVVELTRGGITDTLSGEPGQAAGELRQAAAALGAAAADAFADGGRSLAGSVLIPPAQPADGIDGPALLAAADEITAALLAQTTQVVADAEGRITEREALDDRRHDQAFRVLASILGTPSAAGVGGTTALGELAAALAPIGHAMGVTFPPLTDLPLADATNPMAVIAESASVRARGVQLQPGWQRDPFGPLLCFRSADRSPVALLPASTRRYRAFDPRTDRWTTVDDDYVRGLEPAAVSFTAPLPRGTLTPRSLVRFAFAGTGRAVTTLLLYGFFGALASLLVPVLTGVVFTYVIPRDDRALLWTVVAFFAGTLLAMLVCSITQSLATLRVTGQVEGALSPALWDRLLRLPATFFRGYTTGELANRVDGIDTIRTVLTGAGLSSALTALFSLVDVVLMFVLSWKLALIALAALVPLFALLVALNLWRVRHIRRVITLKGSISGLVYQLLESVPKLRVAGGERRALYAWAASYRRQISAGYTAGLIQAWTTAVGAVLISTVSIFVYWSAAGGGAAGHVSPGTFLAFTTALAQLVTALSAFNTALSPMAQCVPLFERLLPLVEAEPESRPDAVSPGTLSGQLALERITFRYSPDGLDVLSDVSIAARPGEFIAVTGPSGAGKSTLIRLLLGFEQPTSGQVLYDGKELATLDLGAVRRQVGTVLQNAIPGTGSIESVILGNSGGTTDDAWHAAEIADIAADIRAMPMGMHTVVGASGSTFSGGQLQRLNIARAVATRPRLVLLDEATSALDNRTQAAVTAALDELNATRVVVAHRLSTIRDADRVYVLDRGRVVQCGPYDELMAQPGLFRDLISRQLAASDNERQVATA